MLARAPPVSPHQVAPSMHRQTRRQSKLAAAAPDSAPDATQHEEDTPNPSAAATTVPAPAALDVPQPADPTTPVAAEPKPFRNACVRCTAAAGGVRVRAHTRWVPCPVRPVHRPRP